MIRARVGPGRSIRSAAALDAARPRAVHVEGLARGTGPRSPQCAKPIGDVRSLTGGSRWSSRGIFVRCVKPSSKVTTMGSPPNRHAAGASTATDPTSTPARPARCAIAASLLSCINFACACRQPSVSRAAQRPSIDGMRVDRTRFMGDLLSECVGRSETIAGYDRLMDWTACPRKGAQTKSLGGFAVRDWGCAANGREQLAINFRTGETGSSYRDLPPVRRPAGSSAQCPSGHR